MALKTYQPGLYPMGQFDLLDGYYSLVKGGEIGTFFAASRTNSTSEKAARDARDGYTNATDVKRAAIAPRVNATTARPLFLLDEGTTGYGTLFGQVIGGPAGLATSGTNLGPQTFYASGKVTCWGTPGLYGVSVDAVDTSADGLVLTNSSCDPGAKVQPQNDGVLTLSTAGTAVDVTVGRFSEFNTSPFLVSTPASLVGAAESATEVVFHYHVEG
jgi:hypothetical protein